MNFSFNLQFDRIEDFVSHWSPKYSYDETKYTKNIGRPLTEKSRLELFEWKNGGNISKLKLKSIEQNYPLEFPDNLQQRYLNYKLGGGAIWNIFYLHCSDPKEWPIFDQHNYRAMVFIKTSSIVENLNSDKQKYDLYINEFCPFFYGLNFGDYRKLDRALFVFGQFLKKVRPYT